ncbi:MAG: hypothetical protein ABIH23_09885 [bacterium]
MTLLGAGRAVEYHDDAIALRSGSGDPIDREFFPTPGVPLV